MKKTITLLLLMSLLLAIPALAANPSPTSAENLPPVAEDFELTTYRGVGVTGALIAVDPEGDFMEFQLVRSPRKGEVDLDQASGQFTYTPQEGKRGRDHFTYVAVDALGNISAEATVRIRIERQKSNVQYKDMSGHEAHFASISLAERDIFVGEQIGGRHFFQPDTLVRRGEFLAMSMRLVDADLLSGIHRTGFADDAYIAAWLRPYVSTAVLDGVVRGLHCSDGALIFAPDAHITAGEAALVLNNVLGLQDVPAAALWAEIAAPDWAHQAIVNLHVRNIISLENLGVYHRTLTRADVAEVLLGAAHLLEGRIVPTSSLLEWVF